MIVEIEPGSGVTRICVTLCRWPTHHSHGGEEMPVSSTVPGLGKKIPVEELPVRVRNTDIDGAIV